MKTNYVALGLLLTVALVIAASALWFISAKPNDASMLIPQSSSNKEISTPTLQGSGEKEVSSSNKMTTEPNRLVLGTYYGREYPDGSKATLRISKADSNLLKVEAISYWYGPNWQAGGVNFANAEATTTLQGNTIEFSEEEGGNRCIVRIVFSSDWSSATITDPNCTWGLNADLADTYNKAKS